MADREPLSVDELLAQATCAVTGPDDRGRSLALGTAWLVKDDGHLLTAGHVVDAHVAAGEVWVRFPDATEDERATFLVMPINDEAAALDFAVLKLDRPNGRIPLPFTLVSQSEGKVRARGYGENLPQAQSPGEGYLVGNYLRKSSTASYYFQYNTDTLAVGGYSGAAVYSEVAQAIIGLQVEAAGGRTGFAMPLARIAEYWADMVGAAIKPTRGLAVLLQPEAASDLARDIVRERIVRPALESLNLAMYVSELGGTRNEDMRQLEMADVVIADVTHGDPSVIYELTVAHGLGTPDVVVVDEASAGSAGHLFDLVRLDLADVESSRRLVEKRLVSVHSIFKALGEVETANPLTSFFKAPLTQISAANALALGYQVNFVRPVGSALMEAQAYGEAAGVTVTVNDEPLPSGRLEGMTLTTVLPEHLDWASDDFISERLAATGRVMDAVINHPDWSRRRSLKCLPLEEGKPIRLLDPFPTTLTTMMEAIDERLGGGPAVRSRKEWAALEQKEIDRFRSKLVQRIRADNIKVKKLRLSDVFLIASSRAIFPGLD